MDKKDKKEFKSKFLNMFFIVVVVMILYSFYIIQNLVSTTATLAKDKESLQEHTELVTENVNSELTTETFSTTTQNNREIIKDNLYVKIGYVDKNTSNLQLLNDFPQQDEDIYGLMNTNPSYEPIVENAKGPLIYDEGDLEEQNIEQSPLTSEDENNQIVQEEQVERKYISITFDDGPDRRYTPVLLDILKENNAKATFFVLGNKVEKNSDIISRMKEEGHVIGNHTYDHQDLTKLEIDEICLQIDETNNAVKNITFEDVQFMRPSYGARDDEVAVQIENREMSMIMWNIDPYDWKIKDAQAISEHVIERAKAGDIILLHDLYETTIEAAEIIITELTAQGFEFITVPNLIQQYGEIVSGGIYRNGRNVVTN